MGIARTSFKNKVCACVFGSSSRGEITTLKKQKTWVAMGEWGRWKHPEAAWMPRLETLAWTLGVLHGDGEKRTHVQWESWTGSLGVKRERRMRDSQPGLLLELLMEALFT